MATYLIDTLAMKAGYEKDDDDVVGCCKLIVGDVDIPPNKLKVINLIRLFHMFNHRTFSTFSSV